MHEQIDCWAVVLAQAAADAADAAVEAEAEDAAAAAAPPCCCCLRCLRSSFHAEFGNAWQ